MGRQGKIAFSARMIPRDHVLCQEVRGEVILVSLASERYYRLNEAGSRMWHELAKAESIEAAFHVLLESYQVDPQQLRDDLQEFLAKLIEYDLVRLTA